jgi:hypothetical protein
MGLYNFDYSPTFDNVLLAVYGTLSTAHGGSRPDYLVQDTLAKLPIS